MEYCPGASTGLMVATPEALTAAMPSVSVPLVNVTVPVGIDVPATGLTVAEIATEAPAIPGVGVAVSVVVVCVCVTTWLRGAELAAPLHASPA